LIKKLKVNTLAQNYAQLNSAWHLPNATSICGKNFLILAVVGMNSISETFFSGLKKTKLTILWHFSYFFLPI